MNPTVSVIIPCYDQARFLPECIASLQAQSYSDWEAIIVNDGSPDDTRAVAIRLRKQDPRIRYIEQKNRGLSSARNAGVAISRGAFLQFLDSDDALESDKLRHQVEFLKRRPEVEIVFGDVRYFSTEAIEDRTLGPYAKDGKPWIPELWKAEGNLLTKFVRNNLMAVNCPLLRRSVMERVGLWNEKLGALEDWEYWTRCAAANITFEFSNPTQTMALVRLHDLSMTKESTRMLKGAFYYRIATANIFSKLDCYLDSLRIAIYFADILGRQGRGSRYRQLFTAFRQGTARREIAFAYLMSHSTEKKIRSWMERNVPWPIQKILAWIAGKGRALDAPTPNKNLYLQMQTTIQPTNNPQARLIAFYLPQYHPIPENDRWWGTGFTEWTNTAKAKPLFKGHYQPHVPADLGFYDLRVAETRNAQAEMARRYGIEAFCYYHYWFGGKRLLERPFNEVLESGQPNFPFCLCWANQTWSGIWHGEPKRILMEQTYPGMDDHRQHFDYLLRAFLDKRYLCVEGRPVLVIYNPDELPNSLGVTELWRNLAIRAGLPGLFLMAVHNSSDWDPKTAGFDATIISRLPPRRFYMKEWATWIKNPLRKLRYWYADQQNLPTIHQYQYAVENVITKPVPGIESYPCVIPNWDNTPRSGANGLVLKGSTPELFRTHLQKAFQRVHAQPIERRFVFLKSWNEWAEGNHLEPDLLFGCRYLEVVREELQAHDDT